MSVNIINVKSLNLKLKLKVKKYLRINKNNLIFNILNVLKALNV